MPTNPPMTLFEPVLVTGPIATEWSTLPANTSPASFLWRLSTPTRPPSTLLSPPVTAPNAPVKENRPLPEAAKPPASPDDPTVTEPNASEFWIRAFWLKAMPRVQPLQPPSFGPLLPTNPPALLFAPATTLPKAAEFLITPLLSPTNPPAVIDAASAEPTSPVAIEWVITPWFPPTSPPSVVVRSFSLGPEPEAPVTLPIATAYLILPSLNPTSPPAVPFWPTFTSPLAYVSPIWSLGPTSKDNVLLILPRF